MMVVVTDDGRCDGDGGGDGSCDNSGGDGCGGGYCDCGGGCGDCDCDYVMKNKIIICK